jgi:hypothetical protein
VANDEEVGDVAQPSEIQDDEVFCFLVQGGLDTAGDLRGQFYGQLSSSLR